MSVSRRSIALAGLMVTASAAGVALKPQKVTDASAPKIDLETMVPKQFGPWAEVPTAAMVVNPQTQALLDKLYSQILTRTYVSTEGYRIMLSIAYGDDQRGSLEAHMPEVCYPAQGFKLLEKQETVLTTHFGGVPTKQISTVLGTRQEPVTYWFSMGRRTVSNKLDRRLVEIRLALTGQVPDGLLFRVSSIDPAAKSGWEQHARFVNDLLDAVPADSRLRLAGLGQA